MQGFSAALIGHQSAHQAGQIPWTLTTYPNPMVNLEKCGRGHVSHICDPELLLDPKVLDGLDAQIAKSVVPVEIAVFGEVSSSVFGSAWNLDEGFHAFASHLAQDWGVFGKGGSGIFILYSVSDDYIDILTDEKIHIDHGLLRHLARAALRSANRLKLLRTDQVRMDFSNF